MHTGTWWKDQREPDDLEDLDLDEKIMTQKKWDEVVDWIDLAQDKDEWWGFMNMVMKFSSP